MATYSDIQNSFSTYLNRRDNTTAQTQAFIQNALQVINRELRCPAMEKSIIVTIQSGYTGLVIPSDFLELQNIIPQTTQGGTMSTNFLRLEKVDISRALSGALLTDTPKTYCRQGGLWILSPSPAIGDQIRVDYWAENTPLVNGTDTNIISLIAPDLIYYKALSLACDYYSDVRGQSFEARYQQIFDDLQNQSDEDEFSGASAVSPAFAYPDELSDGWDYYPYPEWF